METFSSLLALCVGEFPSQNPVTRSFDVFFDLHLSKPLTKKSRRRRIEMSPRPLWRRRNGLLCFLIAVGVMLFLL